MISVGDYPTYVTFAPNGSRAYVANPNANTVSVISPADNTVIDTVTVGDYPTGLAVTQDGSLLYAANLNGASVSVIDTVDNIVVHTITLTGSSPGAVAISPDGSTCTSPATTTTRCWLSVRSMTAFLPHLPVSSPDYLALSNDGQYLYVP